MPDTAFFLPRPQDIYCPWLLTLASGSPAGPTKPLTPDSTGVTVQMANTVCHLLVSVGQYRPPRSAPNAPCIPSPSPCSPSHLSGVFRPEPAQHLGEPGSLWKDEMGEEHVPWTGRGWAGASLPAVLLAFPSIQRDKRGVSVHHRRCMASQMTPPQADRGAWETKKLLAQGWWSVLEESAAGGQNVCDKSHQARRSQPGLMDSFATLQHHLLP